MDWLKEAFWPVMIAFNLAGLAANIQRSRKKPWKGFMVLSAVLFVMATVLLIVRSSS